MNTLLDLEARITQHLEGIEDQESFEYKDAYKMLYKTVREQARLNSLLKEFCKERRNE